jgi:tetratricopeptide (TPR) repeat protein
MKRYAEAAQAYDQLKTYKPDAKTYNALGESYFELNKSEDSLQAFNSALGYDPEFDKARYNLGRAYVKMGNPKWPVCSTRSYGIRNRIGPIGYTC